MATTKRRTRRRRKAGRKTSRRRGGIRAARRGGGSFARRGFINKDMIKPTVGVVTGFILPDMLLRMLPNNVQASLAQSKYGPMVAKSAIALAVGYFGRRFDPVIAGNFAVGGLAAGGLDLIYRMRGMVGQQSPTASITTTQNGNRRLTTTGVAGLMDMDTGEYLNGFVDNDGSVLNRMGQGIGVLVTDTGNAPDDDDDDDDDDDTGITGFIDND